VSNSQIILTMRWATRVMAMFLFLPRARAQRPRERELRRLDKYESEFKAWLIRHEILREPWNWDAYPL
jgi:hypothetical protein